MGDLIAFVPDGMEPLAVWDSMDGEGPWRRPEAGKDNDERHALMIQAADWAAERIERIQDTYRAEFYLIDMPFAVIYRHQRNENGRLHWNPETQRPHREEPVIVPLGELPPAHLLRQS